MEMICSKLNEATKAYDEGHPIMSDKEWDDLYFQLQEMERKTGVVLPESPTNYISYLAVNKLQKVTHNHEMLSLNKTKDISEVIRFAEDKPLIAMAKMDGLTCSLTYKDGVLVRAETRGNGIVGEDVTHNAFVIPSIPKQIDTDSPQVVIDGEIICTYLNFERYNTEYKNPRNFAAGSIRLLDSKECRQRGLEFIAWDVVEGLPKYNQLSDRLVHLRDKFKFRIVPVYIIPVVSQFSIEDTMYVLKEDSCVLKYPIDGVVFKYNNIEDYNAAGKTAHHFKGGLAYKFYDEEYETSLIDIDWQIGRTGILSPIAIFEPVEIEGTTVSRASVHNLNIIEQTFGTPYKGQKIWITKRNLIIPNVERAEKATDKIENIKLITPTICPCCGNPLTIDKDAGTITCKNSNCTALLINKLDYFCSKNGLEIKGLSKKTLAKLMDWNWLNSISDIYALEDHKTEWIQKEGFGKASVEKILDNINKSKNCELSSFIAALGIPLIGGAAAKELCKHIVDYNDLKSKIANNFPFYSLATFGDNMHQSIVSFDYTEADKLVKSILKISNNISHPSLESNDNIRNKVFCITGKLQQYKNRSELKAVIEKYGGRVTDSISAKTDYLVNNDINSETAKNKQAKQKNIPIITEEEFQKFLT